MTPLEEILKKSEENLEQLDERINAFDQILSDIEILKEKPEEIHNQFEGIARKVNDFTSLIGKSTKDYLDGNNRILESKLRELQEQKELLKAEVTRLTETDFSKLFEELKAAFLEQSTKLLQEKIDSLNEEINRLHEFDLDKHFEKHQKKLSDIFDSINQIHSACGNILSGISRNSESIAELKNGQNESKGEIEKMAKSIASIKEQQTNSKHQLDSLTQTSVKIAKGQKLNQLILTVGLVVVLTFLILNLFI